MIETFRSTVHTWECDAVEHFTTAYYYRAFGVANWHLLQRLGLDAAQLVRLDSGSCRTRFLRELRAGDPYHLVSGVIDSGTGSARIGHRLINSETGEMCASHVQHVGQGFDRSGGDLAIAEPDDGPMGDIAFDTLTIWSRTAVNVLNGNDIDHSGRMSLSTLIHMASDANVQFQNRIGMTSSYMHENRIGFATMGYEIGLSRLPAEPGTVIEIESALAKLGRTSLWMAHRVVDGRTRASIADVAQFGVHLDRKARRPAEIPDQVRTSAQIFLGSKREHV